MLVSGMLLLSFYDGSQHTSVMTLGACTSHFPNFI
jgi:hypothetical protein